MEVFRMLKLHQPRSTRVKIVPEVPDVEISLTVLCCCNVSSRSSQFVARIYDFDDLVQLVEELNGGGGGDRTFANVVVEGLHRMTALTPDNLWRQNPTSNKRTSISSNIGKRRHSTQVGHVADHESEDSYQFTYLMRALKHLPVTEQLYVVHPHATASQCQQLTELCNYQ